MTLNKKIEKIVDKPFTIDDLEKIADNYAIEFAKWLIDIDNKPKIHYTVKEMLEIFKKEKELLNQDL